MEPIIKKCRICGKEFTITNPHAGSRQFCYDCVPETDDDSKRTVYKRRAIKKQGVALLGGKCAKCGCDEYYLLNFHHLDPSKKDDTPSRLIADSKIEDFFNEIQGCILLCSNCHQRFHFLESEEGLKIEDYVDMNNIISSFEDFNREYTTHKHFCKKCGKEIDASNKSGLCIDCYRQMQQEGRPEPLELANLIMKHGFEGVGRMYDVTGNSIKKWCRAYNIPYKKQELKEWLANQLDQ